MVPRVHKGRRTGGPQGFSGADGATGPIGPAGLQGPQGVVGANGVGFNFRSAFDNSLTYAVNDVVTYAGSSYVAVAISQGPNNPTPDVNPAAWSLMAQQGATGTPGPAGPQGFSGADGATGPIGPAGLQGPQGVVGANGVGFNFRSAFDNSLTHAVNDVVTYAGSSYVAVAISQGPNNPTPDVNPAAWSLMAQQGATGTPGPAGPQGFSGADGATGPIGPAGLQGPQGVVGANGVGFNFRSAFDNSLTYAVNDVVTYAGSSYVAVAISQGPNNPTPDVSPAAWSLMAQQGATGTPGPAGPQGFSGTDGATGPIGPAGPQGPQGVVGANGVGFNFRSAFDNSLTYAVNDVVTYAGSSYVAVAISQGPNNPTPDVNPAAWSLMAQQGATGTPGPAGPQGFSGADGATGPIGPAGLQGPQGVVGANGVGFNFRSAFDNSLTYAVNDVVTYAGSSYVAVAISQGPNNPTPDVSPAAWSLMAQQGATGTPGPAGPQGFSGTDGATGPIGPAGPQGPQGVVGATGPAGPQGPQGVVDPKYTITLCQIDLDGSGASGLLQSTDAATMQCINALGSSVTVTSVQCVADVAGGSTVQIAASGGSLLLTTACRVGNTLTTCNLNGSPSLASGQWLNSALTPDGVQKHAHCVVAGTY